VTVAIGNEISIEASPAASASSLGGSGRAGGLLTGASHISDRPAAGLEGGPSAQSFRARWQSEIAAMHSVGQGDDEDKQTAAGNAEGATGREAKSGFLPGFAGGNVSVSRQAAGANGSMSATAARNPAGNSAIRNSEIDGQDDALPETGPGGSAKSSESKETQNNREARKREDTRGQAKDGAQSDAASIQPMTGTSMEMMLVVVPQQQIQISALFGTSTPTGPLGASAAGESAGNTKTKMAVEGGVRANAHPGQAARPLRGLAPGGGISAADGRPATVTSGEDLGEDNVRGAARSDPEAGLRDESPSGDGTGGGEQKLALPAETLQSAHTQTAADGFAGAQADTGQSTAAAASIGAADSSRAAAPASRPRRSSNAGPGVGQSPGQIPVPAAGERSASQGHEGGMAIAPAMGVAGATHGAGTAAGAPGSGSENGLGKSADETFAAMDAQANGLEATWVHAGPHQAEAGFQDPALGWVAVRAEMGAGGGVHAAIVPGTADAAQTLGGHMAGLSAHLAEQRVGVSSVSMNSPGVAPELAGGGAGQNGGQYGAGSGQNQGQQHPAGPGAVYAMPSVASASGARETARLDGTQPAAATSGMRGRHISVVV
jgi:hypothetical protein